MAVDEMLTLAAKAHGGLKWGNKSGKTTWRLPGEWREWNPWDNTEDAVLLYVHLMPLGYTFCSDEKGMYLEAGRYTIEHKLTDDAVATLACLRHSIVRIVAKAQKDKQ